MKRRGEMWACSPCLEYEICTTFPRGRTGGMAPGGPITLQGGDGGKYRCAGMRDAKVMNGTFVGSALAPIGHSVVPPRAVPPVLDDELLLPTRPSSRGSLRVRNPRPRATHAYANACHAPDPPKMTSNPVCFAALRHRERLVNCHLPFFNGQGPRSGP